MSIVRVHIKGFTLFLSKLEKSHVCLRIVDAGEITGLQGAALFLWFCLMVSVTFVVGDSVFMSQSSHDPRK